MDALMRSMASAGPAENRPPQSLLAGRLAKVFFFFAIT
jgi:hypothetical protein